MSSFAVGCVYYNDVKSLIRLLDSVTDYFDFCIMIDGAFFAHPGTNRLSTDGSRELMDSYRNVIGLDLPDLTEAQKRNGYLWMAKHLECDWLLILDSDEFVVIDGDFRKSAEKILDTDNNHYVYDVMSLRPNTDYVKFDPRPRLWYQPWDMQYTTCHCCYGRKDGKIRKNERPCVENIMIYHDKCYRTEQHTSDWLKFVTYQLDAESQEGVSL